MSEKQAVEDEKKEVEDKYLREQARFATLEKEQEDLLVCMGKVSFNRLLLTQNPCSNMSFFTRRTRFGYSEIQRETQGIGTRSNRQ